MIWSLSCLTFGLGQDPSLSSALGLSTFRNSHSNRSSYCSYVSFVMYITTDSLWSSSAKKKKRRHATVRWIDTSPFSFSCVACQDFGHLQRADNPHGAANTTDGERASHSCSRNVHFCLFFLFFRGSGDIIMHHILVADKQLWRRRAPATGSSSFFFLKCKNAGRSVQRSSRWCITLSHTLNESVDVYRL